MAGSALEHPECSSLPALGLAWPLYSGTWLSAPAPHGCHACLLPTRSPQDSQSAQCCPLDPTKPW